MLVTHGLDQRSPVAPAKGYPPSCAVSCTTHLAIDPQAAEAETSPAGTAMNHGTQIIAAALLATWIPHPTLAQSYTIDKPGQLPIHVRATAGGATITKPGELPTYVRSTGSGGATISKPGELPTYVRPGANGSATISKPGQLPTYVRATSGGGATISKPGELPVHVRPTSGGFIVQKSGELPTYVRKSGGGKDGLTAADVAKYLPGIAAKAEKKQGRK